MKCQFKVKNVWDFSNHFFEMGLIFQMPTDCYYTQFEMKCADFYRELLHKFREIFPLLHAPDYKKERKKER